MPGSRRVRSVVTRADVARHAGVSTAVVSYVINNGPRPVATLTAVGAVTGWHQSDALTGPGIVGDRLVNNPMPWFTLRALTALLGAAGVVLVWDAARRFGAPDWAAAWAAATGAVAPLLLSAAQRVASDGYSVFFAMACVWTLAWALQRPSLGRQVALGVAIGLVVSAKYNGAPLALLAVVVPLAAGGSWRRRAGWCSSAPATRPGRNWRRPGGGG